MANEIMGDKYDKLYTFSDIECRFNYLNHRDAYPLSHKGYHLGGNKQKRKKRTRRRKKKKKKNRSRKK